MTDQLTPDERLTVVDIADWDDDVAKLLRLYDAQTATLERVRVLAGEDVSMVFADAIRAALAGQPEAPKEDLFKCAGCEHGHPNWHRYMCPNQPKADLAKDEEPWQALFPAAQSEWDRLKDDLAAAKAKISEQDAHWRRRQDNWRASSEAKIAELEREKSALVEAHDMWNGQWAEANARADAAEREMHTAHQQTEAALRQRDQLAARVEEMQRACDGRDAIAHFERLWLRDNARADAAERDACERLNRYNECTVQRDQLAQKLEAAESRLADYQAMVDDIDPPDVLIHWRQDRAERDQLAARVTELESALEERNQRVNYLGSLDTCTPEERQVLEACADRCGAELDYDDWRERVIEWCERVMGAELANRAAKAKRGDCSGCGSAAKSCAALTMPALKCCPDCSHGQREAM